MNAKHRPAVYLGQSSFAEVAAFTTHHILLTSTVLNIDSVHFRQSLRMVVTVVVVKQEECVRYSGYSDSKDRRHPFPDLSKDSLHT